MSVELKNVEKKYGKNYAIRDINLKIEKGEFFVLLGPSGSGKTTVLRCVAGLEKINNGQILIDGKDVTNLPPGNRNVAMVFQNFALYPNKTVYENLSMPIEYMRKEDREKLIEDVSKRLGINELLNRFPSELSGGQQQRVALARALVKNSKVFLMDEPLSNLDAPQRISARKLIREIQLENSITTLYVTHDQTEAMAIADKIGIISNGKIVQVGTPEEIYENPVNSFVASFFGNPPMSIIDGKIIDSNKKIGIRAEDVKIGEGKFQGTIKDIEFWGDRYLLYISFNNEEIRAFSNNKFKIGEEIKFDFKYKIIGE
ncbi:ATP-binding cassette domain-containing protein [Acidianus sulfidivorans JP7]|uniref:ABC transporter ATP-binding protein n=1 Tax=Acidianus sulfidivorans TaxID=312539 RepID=UPI001443397C|nr:ABC transporter ATP-binding protein [Acidianus sulfidivorans]AWR97934.2 ATP-binding cassette domain-containing protein [Acidianus sulfidivorans JP7]